MKVFLFLLNLVITLNSYSQKIEKYYNYKWQECKIEDARFYSTITKTDTGWYREDYFVNLNSLHMTGTYADEECKISNGLFNYYYSNRRLQYSGKFIRNKKEGLWLSYYYNGMMSDSSVYINGRKVGTGLSWYPNGYISDSVVSITNGKSVYVSWFDNGNPSCVGRHSERNKKDGKWKYYHKNGKLSSIELFKEGTLLDKQYYDDEGNSVEDTTNKETGAEFKGGEKAWQKYLAKNLYFPSNYILINANKVVVVVDFVISEDGTVENAYTSVPFDAEFDRIALKIINQSPKWIPASQNNRHVKQYIRQVVVFAQQEFD